MQKDKKIGLAADHAGYRLKEGIRQALEAQGYSLVDYGTDGETSVDYPDFSAKLAAGLQRGEVGMGIATCGSGNGISMSLNRHSGIRAALCWQPELARLARAHNDANILALPGRFVTLAEAMEMVRIFLGTEFEGGRHSRRVKKIDGEVE